MFTAAVEERAGESGRRIAAMRVGGRATIESARKAWESLSRAFAEADEVELSLSEVSETDLSLVQIVLAAMKAGRGKPFALVGEPAESFRRVLEEAGVALPAKREREKPR